MTEEPSDLPAPVEGPLAATVAVLTRRRPAMLEATLRSFAALRPAPGLTPRFLVVENDDAPRTREAVEALAGLFPEGRLAYVHEPELGIPFGRNRAATEAAAAGHDLLLFVDDDMVVAEDWLLRFVEGYRESGALLMGAPMLAAPAPAGATAMERRIHAALARRYARKAERAAGRATLHATPGITIVTNNWLGDMRLFTRHGLRFDTGLRFTGGSDTRFYHDATAKGLKTGWVAAAVAWEVIPRERLSLAYQYARGRDQSNQNLARKRAEGGGSAWSAIPAVAVRALGLVVLALGTVVSGGRWLPDLARNAGWIAGRWGALTGRRSRLYENVTGN